MLVINYPEPSFRIKKENNKEYIFDPLRKKWLFLTPEEWVRQNFLQYLIAIKQYPASFIALEKEIQLGMLTKRFDILIYNRNYQPWMMVECKMTEIEPDEKVLQQILRYHISVAVDYLVITNGHFSFAWKKINGVFEEINELPLFNE